MLVCVYIRTFHLDVMTRWHLPGQISDPAPHRIVVDDKRPLQVRAYSPELGSFGIRVGMPEREARALCPEALVLIHHDQALVDAQQALINCLFSLAPRLEAAQPGLVYLDIGSWRDLEMRRQYVLEIQETLRREFHFQPSFGLAQNRFVALVAASSTPPGTCLYVEPGEETTFLGDKGIHLLPVQPETIRRLNLLGLNTLGQIAEVPTPDLVRQFGKEARLITDLAHGVDSTPLNLYRPPAQFRSFLNFEPPLERQQQIHAAVLQQMEALFQEYRASFQCYTHLNMLFHFEACKSSELRISLPPSLSRMEDLSRIALIRLTTHVFSSPVIRIEMLLESKGTNLETCHQNDFWDAPTERQRQSLNRWLAQPRWQDYLLIRAVEDDVQARIPEWWAHLEEWHQKTRVAECYQPQPVEVKLDEMETPAAVLTETGWHRIETVFESWEVEDIWWTETPVHRLYFLVLLTQGTVLAIFQDLLSSQWYQQL